MAIIVNVTSPRLSPVSLRLCQYWFCKKSQTHKELEDGVYNELRRVIERQLFQHSDLLITVVICWVSRNLADIRYWKTLSCHRYPKTRLIKSPHLIRCHQLLLKSSKSLRILSVSVSPFSPYCPRSQIIFILHNLPTTAHRITRLMTIRGLWLVSPGQYWPLIGWQPQWLSSNLVRCQLRIFWWPSVTW